jgi:hypothetical protein
MPWMTARPAGSAPFSDEGAGANDSPDLPVAEVRSQDVPAPDIHALEIHAPDIRVPDIRMPDIHAPDIHAPDINGPDLTAPEVGSSDTTADTAETPPWVVAITPYWRQRCWRIWHPGCQSCPPGDEAGRRSVAVGLSDQAKDQSPRAVWPMRSP